MSTHFQKTAFLSEILEKSAENPVIIFKFSSDCNSSARLADEIEKAIKDKKIENPVYKVTVQTEPALSKKIESHFSIKHETPQILVVDNGKVTYTNHHDRIYVRDFSQK